MGIDCQNFCGGDDQEIKGKEANLKQETNNNNENKKRHSIDYINESPEKRDNFVLIENKNEENKRQKELDERQKELDEREEILKKNEKDLIEKKQEFENENKMILNKRQKEFDKRQKELDEKEKILKKNEKDLIENKQKFENETKSKKIELNNREKDLNEKEIQLNNFQEKLNLLDKKLKDENKKLEEEKNKQKQDIINEKEEIKKEKEEIKKEKEKNKENEKLLEDKETDIQTKITDIKKRENALKESVRKNDDKEKELNEKEKILIIKYEKKENDLKNKEKDIDIKNKNLNKKQKELEIIEEEKIKIQEQKKDMDLKMKEFDKKFNDLEIKKKELNKSLKDSTNSKNQELEKKKKEIEEKENDLKKQENVLKEKENNIKLRETQLNQKYEKFELEKKKHKEEYDKLNNKLIEREKAIEAKEIEITESKKPILIGLNNIGATCYMNATLQCLSNTKKLTEFFLNIYKISPNKNMSNEYYKVLTNIWDRKLNNKSYSPNSFKEVLSKENPLFAGIAANDSKDLINFLLERFHQELNTENPNKNINNNMIAAEDQTNEKSMLQLFLEEFKQKFNSPISNLFYGIIETKSQCLGCKIIKFNFQVYSFLEFPLQQVNEYFYNQGRKPLYTMNGQNPDVNLYECFEYYSKVDLMNGENQMYCNICNKLFDSYYSTVIYSSPIYLIINLNRGKGATYQCKVNFPEQLNIFNHVTFKDGYTAYGLYAVICHLGPSSMSGHFVAYCRNRNDNKWYLYNDAFVNPCTKPQQYNDGMPYILFYKALTLD